MKNIKENIKENIEENLLGIYLIFSNLKIEENI